MKIIKIYLILLGLAISSIGIGQSEDTIVSYDLEPLPKKEIAPLDDIYILTKSSSKGLEFRWAPTNIKTWQMGIDHGYRIEKIGFKADTTLVSLTDFSLSPSRTIKPWPLDEWEPIVNEDRPYCAIAAMSIYGEEKNPQKGFVNEAQALENRHGFNVLAADLDVEAAEASGLYFVEKDKSITSCGGMYRIYTLDESTGESSDTAYVMTMYADNQELYAPTLLDNVEYENAIAIRWYNQRGTKKYSAFHIERSNDGKTFARLTKKPFIYAVTSLRPENDMITYTDSVDQNGVDYYYRVIGIDAFATESPASEVMVAQGKEKVNLTSPINVSVDQKDNDKLVVSWEAPMDIPNDIIAGYRVMRALDVDDEFVTISDKLLSNNTRSFTDENPDSRETNYYKVIVVDTDGNEATSALSFGFTKDDIAPQVPTNLVAEIDTLGNVLLEWDAPKDNDIRGYRVFWSYEKDGNYAVQSGKLLPNTHFVDELKLKSLTEVVYYYVIAVDYSYNRSEASEIYTLKKPDIIPPAASIFADYKVSEDGIYFEWIASASLDVTSIKLERSSSEEGTWTTVESFDMEKNSFLDINVEGGKLYQYRLLTTDDAGNRTYNIKPLTLEALTPFYIPSVTEFKAEYKEGNLTLSWSYDNAEEYEYMVYRQLSNGNLKSLKKISGKTSFTDHGSRPKARYAVVARAKDGRESRMSEKITIN